MLEENFKLLKMEHDEKIKVLEENVQLLTEEKNMEIARLKSENAKLKEEKAEVEENETVKRRRKMQMTKMANARKARDVTM